MVVVAKPPGDTPPSSSRPSIPDPAIEVLLHQEPRCENRNACAWLAIKRANGGSDDSEAARARRWNWDDGCPSGRGIDSLVLGMDGEGIVGSEYNVRCGLDDGVLCDGRDGE